MAREGIMLVHGLTKSTLITYFSGMKIDPKYAFLHAFFLICLVAWHVLSKICLYDQKHTLFSNFTHFCTPKRHTRVHCLVLKNNPNYVNFWTSLIPPWHSTGPPGTLSHFENGLVIVYILLDRTEMRMPLSIRGKRCARPQKGVFETLGRM